MIATTDIRPGTEEPPRGVSGYFLVWTHLSDRPIVLYRGTLSTKWRNGCRVENVDYWCGPLPERTEFEK